jgi:hypothetical protein
MGLSISLYREPLDSIELWEWWLLSHSDSMELQFGSSFNADRGEMSSMDLPQTWK